MISVSILVFIGFLITCTFLLIGVSVSKTSIESENTFKARSYANACAEKVLLNIKTNKEYSGDEIISYTYGSCTIGEINLLSGTNETIEITGNVGNSISKIQLDMQEIESDVWEVSWREVSDFE